MKILYVSQYFPPEMGAPAARVHELSRRWVQDGHEVTVLTGFPNHPIGVVPPEYKSKLKRLVYRERIDGINVIRTILIPLPNRRAWERILNYASFCLSACVTGSFLSTPDVIIATSPQLLVGLSGLWLSKIKRVPLVFEVRDLWPESIVATDMGSENSIAIRVLKKISGTLYKVSDCIVVVTPAFESALVRDWDVPLEKISIVMNGVDTKLFSPSTITNNVLRQELGLQDKFVVSYIGTMGAAHGLDTVIQAASQMEETMPEAMFLFVGDGAERERVENSVRALGLSNVMFVPPQPKAKVPEYINASDVCLVPLKAAEVFKTVIPTKMLEFMACGCPIVLGVDGQARHLLEDAQGGTYVEPENVEALVQAIKQLYQDPDLRRSLGSNGHKYAMQHASRENTAKVYIDILESIIKK